MRTGAMRRGTLRAEDLALVGWNLVVLPVGAAGFFSEFMASLLEGLDLGGIAGALFGSGGGLEVATIGGLVLMFVVGGSAAFYVMLVVAPRELAFPEPRPVVWAIRFVLFLASSLIGVGGWLFL